MVYIETSEKLISLSESTFNKRWDNFFFYLLRHNIVKNLLRNIGSLIFIEGSIIFDNVIRIR